MIVFQISKSKNSNHSKKKKILMSLAGFNKADLFYCIKLKALHNSLLDSQNLAIGIITLKLYFLFNTISPK